jgi:thiol:disulfide interchange protein DsbC
MNKRYLLHLLLSLALSFLRLTYAGEQEIKEQMARKFPYSKLLSVAKTPFLGLYEVAFDDRLVYTDAEMKYLFLGNVLDLRTLHNLTEDREKQLYAIDFDTLPFESAIKKVVGNGSRRLAVFSDPNCKYCKKLEKELSGLKNATIYTFLLPILPGSEEKANKIWCSADRLKAWEDQMLKDIEPLQVPRCDTTPLGKIGVQASKLRVNVTPTMVFPDGVIRPGIITLDLLEERLADSGTKR